MDDGPTAPASWRLTPADIQQMAQDAVGTPAPQDNSWRPAGGSLLSGVGQCLYDELKAILELTQLLIQLDADLDIASDGQDNWFFWRSVTGDAARVGQLFMALEAGTQTFSVLPKEQQMALFRLYAKLEALKATLRDISKAGVNLLAAYDVYWSEYEVLTMNQAENALKGLADAVSLLFTEQEWASLARGGKDLADQVTKLIQQQVESDPWGSAGYAACLVALFLSPTKVLRALRGVMGALGRLGGAATTAELAAILRANRVRVPAWLGGGNEVAAAAGDATRVADKVEPPVPPARTGDEIVVEGRKPVEAADDANPVRPHEPTERVTPEPDANTTHVAARTKRIGDMAEADARKRLEAEGFKTFELKNGSGHGPDIIAVKPGSPPRITIIEVKANGSALNELQQKGGPAYLQNVFSRVDASPGGGSWNTRAFDDFLEELGIENRSELMGGEFEIWRYKGVDPDNPASVANGPEKAPWTPGTTAREFRLDAQGNIESRVGPNRPWTKFIELDE
ncbi:hypothetical protein [Paracoccus zhejiangensis]|uniref:Uncharacterized protein n=1 Tax=Paracoccus zhejiangensis TaxID=1077935 RepID=A0A2H5F150_9RHOB|nr:hypothetical protein [Paracoccus zhejiangensis]AUH65257.1 hypothetical protein CX676_14695 [Paracoccus zhejiangensis]